MVGLADVGELHADKRRKTWSSFRFSSRPELSSSSTTILQEGSYEWSQWYSRSMRDWRRLPFRATTYRLDERQLLEDG